MAAGPHRSDLLTAIVLGALALGSAACGSSPRTDLPPGWEGAVRIEDFAQLPCEGDAYAGPPEAIAVQPGAGRLSIEYQHAHFRCQQDVEGFLRRGVGTVDVLVQPVDMDPKTVARCDCRYPITIGLSMPPGSYVTTVFRRWDNINTPNAPVEIGSSSVVIE